MGEHRAICRLGVFYDGSFFSCAQNSPMTAHYGARRHSRNGSPVEARAYPDLSTTVPRQVYKALSPSQ
jgi:hypothetical protein